MDAFIPIIIVSVPFVFAAVALIVKGIENNQRDKMQAELYLKAIERGQKLPDDIFKKEEKKSNDLRTGLILISIGVGLTLFLYAAVGKEEPRASLAGIIPLFLGIGFMISHYLVNGKSR